MVDRLLAALVEGEPSIGALSIMPMQSAQTLGQAKCEG